MTPEASPILLEKVSSFYYPSQCLSYGSYPFMCRYFFLESMCNYLKLGYLDHYFNGHVFPECGMHEYARVTSQEQQVKLINSRKQRPKKHISPHCQNVFSNEGQLKGQMRIYIPTAMPLS